MGNNIENKRTLPLFKSRSEAVNASARTLSLPKGNLSAKLPKGPKENHPNLKQSIL